MSLNIARDYPGLFRLLQDNPSLGYSINAEEWEGDPYDLGEEPEPQRETALAEHYGGNGDESSESVRRIYAAVMLDAIECAQGARCTLAEQRDARRWLMSPDRTDEYCFLTMCETLSIDPNKVRSAVRNGVTRLAI